MPNINSPVTPQEQNEFDELCHLEPRLKELYDEARAIKDDPSAPSFCANAVWLGYGQYTGQGMKHRMIRLVGYAAGRPTVPDTLGIGNMAQPGATGNPFIDHTVSAADLIRKAEEALPVPEDFPKQLRTSRAYDVAYKVIYRALPDCRNCVCM